MSAVLSAVLIAVSLLVVISSLPRESSAQVSPDQASPLEFEVTFASLDVYSRRYGGGALDDAQAQFSLEGAQLDCGDMVTLFARLYLSDRLETAYAQGDHKVRYILETSTVGVSAGARLELSHQPRLNRVALTLNAEGREVTRFDTAYQSDLSEGVSSGSTVNTDHGTRYEVYVTGLNRGEQLIIRHDAQVICEPNASALGALSVNVAQIDLDLLGATDEPDVTPLRFSLDAERAGDVLPTSLMINRVEALGGARAALPRVAIAERSSEGTCPTWSTWRNAHVPQDELTLSDDAYDSARQIVTTGQDTVDMCLLISNTGTQPLSDTHVFTRRSSTLDAVPSGDLLSEGYEMVTLRTEDATLLPGQSSTYSVVISLDADQSRRIAWFEAVLTDAARALQTRDAVSLVGAPSEDSDQDGLSDVDELRYGTDLFDSDTDDDALSDLFEIQIGTDPLDADTDDDGLIDGYEATIHTLEEARAESQVSDDPADYLDDRDRDGLSNPLDPDSDNDGLMDGLERGVTRPHADTDLSAGHFVPDADPSTRSNHTAIDTDRGGCLDVQEDWNRDGAIDDKLGEADPSDGEDDLDQDQDTLCDVVEAALGSDPLDDDSDDDGLADQYELNPSLDLDDDLVQNILDPDSDGDGLSDGLERGVVTPPSGTERSAGFFTPDQDPSTTTDPWRADSDGDGLADGVEDANRDGSVSRDETDPNDPLDDGRDDDGDGVINAIDLCPSVSDPDQADLDQDGVGDACDDDQDGDLIYDGLTSSRAEGCAAHAHAQNRTGWLWLTLLVIGWVRSRRRIRLGKSHISAMRGALLSLVCALGIIMSDNAPATGVTFTENRALSARPLILGSLYDSFIGGESPFLSGEWGANLSYGWAHDLIELSLEDRYSTPLLEQRVETTLSGWFRPHRRVMISAMFPGALYQSRPDVPGNPALPNGLSALKSRALGDLTLGARFSLYQSASWGHAISVLLGLPTATSDAYFGEDAPTYNLSYLGGYQGANSRLYWNLRHSFLPESTIIGETRGDQSETHLSWQLRMAGREVASAKASEGVELKASQDSTTQEQADEQPRGGFWGGLGVTYRTDRLNTRELATYHDAVFALAQLSYEWERWSLKAYGGRALLYDLTSPQWQAGALLQFQMRAAQPPPKLPAEPIAEEEPPELVARPQLAVDPDPDQDGVPRDQDRCPKVAGDPRFDGCPEDDVDGDLVKNQEDYCMWAVGLTDRHGCPGDELPIPPELREKITFEFGQFQLSDEAITYIKALADFMNANPHVHVHLSGHADTVGDMKYNQALSKRRAWAVYAYLTRRLGISNDRVSYFAHSKRYPIRHIDAEQFHALSRRVTVTFIHVLEGGDAL